MSERYCMTCVACGDEPFVAKNLFHALIHMFKEHPPWRMCKCRKDGRNERA